MKESIFAKKKIALESIAHKEDSKENISHIIVITDLFLERELQYLYENILNLESVNKIRSIRIESN